MNVTEADLLLSRQFAHDLRSPMAALLVLVTTLRQQVELEGRAPDPAMLAMMEEALLAMDAMLMGLVAIGGGEGPGGATAPAGPFSVSDTLRRIEALLAPWQQVRGVTFTWEVLGPDTWEGHADLIAHLLFLLLVSLVQTASNPADVFRLTLTPETEPFGASAEPCGLRVQIETHRPLPDPEVLSRLLAVVDGTLARTRACQAHLPLEGALWLTRALGARLDVVPEPGPPSALRFVLPLRRHHPPA